VFNSVIANWKLYSAYSSQDAKLLLERNFYVAGPVKQVLYRVLDKRSDGSLWDGWVRSKENRFCNGATLEERGAANVPDPPYPYTAWRTSDCNFEQIKAQSGRQTWPQWPESCGSGDRR
jgi:hypothetical protein